MPQGIGQTAGDGVQVGKIEIRRDVGVNRQIGQGKLHLIMIQKQRGGVDRRRRDQQQPAGPVFLPPFPLIEHYIQSHFRDSFRAVRRADGLGGKRQKPRFSALFCMGQCIKKGRECQMAAPVLKRRALGISKTAASFEAAV